MPFTKGNNKMRNLLLILLCLPMIGFGQSNFKLGDYTKFTKNNIEFHLKKPLHPFEQSDESLSFKGDKNYVFILFLFHFFSSRYLPLH